MPVLIFARVPLKTQVVPSRSYTSAPSHFPLESNSAEKLIDFGFLTQGTRTWVKKDTPKSKAVIYSENVR